jgi:hypothetical protein
LTIEHALADRVVAAHQLLWWAEDARMARQKIP